MWDSLMAGKSIQKWADFLRKSAHFLFYGEYWVRIELSAIRFFHDQIPCTKHKLPDNSALDLQRRQFGKVDRTWSVREFNLFVAKALELGREDYTAIFCLARIYLASLDESGA